MAARSPANRIMLQRSYGYSVRKMLADLLDQPLLGQRVRHWRIGDTPE